LTTFAGRFGSGCVLRTASVSISRSWALAHLSIMFRLAALIILEKADGESNGSNNHENRKDRREPAIELDEETSGRGS
jgi:hypothetical protein